MKYNKSEIICAGDYMDYITIKEAAAKWGVSTRAVTYHVAGGRVEGAAKRGNLWLIPKDTLQPEDRRKKSLLLEHKEPPIGSKQKFSWGFQSLYENKELFKEIVKNFPYPMHICAPDGTILLANEAFLKFAKISNPERLYKKHNIMMNPALERWGIKDFVMRAFKGETIHVYDIKVPYQEIVERLGDNKEIVTESLFQNISALPIRNSTDELLFVVFIFITSRSYKDIDEIMKGKEYIDTHWKEEFDISKLVNAVHMSKYHYIRIFKQHTGMTPYNYYQNVKVNKLKEKLCDRSLSIVQAFSECGLDYGGNFSKVFKQRIGISPLKFRNRVMGK